MLQFNTLSCLQQEFLSWSGISQSSCMLKHIPIVKAEHVGILEWVYCTMCGNGSGEKFLQHLLPKALSEETGSSSKHANLSLGPVVMVTYFLSFLLEEWTSTTLCSPCSLHLLQQHCVLHCCITAFTRCNRESIFLCAQMNQLKALCLRYWYLLGII